MAIARGARVIANRGGAERPGTVLREVAPHTAQTLDPAEGRTVKQYEVEMPEHGQWPAWTDVFTEDELTPVPHDPRARRA